MLKKYVVRLTDQERAELAEVVKKLKGTGQKVRRAQVLLKADADGPGWTDRQIAEAFGCRTRTVEALRQRLVGRGFDEALNGAARAEPPTPRLLDGEQEAKVIATRLGPPPPAGVRQLDAAAAGPPGGRAEHRRVRQPRDAAALPQKSGVSNRKVQYWVIPPKADGAFAAGMEEVLETYALPYDPARPVLTTDEQPVQLLKETRAPIPATAAHPRRVDYEYERAGTANIFVFAEPLACWRQVSVRETKTKVDWATEMAALLEGRYAACERVILVCDNLNTHATGAFYEVFEPGRAGELARRLEFRHTPRHGSWLNIAANELSALTRQCVAGRRFGDVEALRRETWAWSIDVNGQQKGVEWHMKIDDARVKLASVYPKIKL